MASRANRSVGVPHAAVRLDGELCRRSEKIKRSKLTNQTWLDIGCGDFALAMMLYVNKYKPKQYYGVDVRNLEDKKPKLDYSIEQLEKKRNDEIHLK